MKALILIVLFSMTCNSYADISVITGHRIVFNDQDRQILIDFSLMNRSDFKEIFNDERATISSDALNELIDSSLPSNLETRRQILIDVDMIESIKLKQGAIEESVSSDF